MIDVLLVGIGGFIGSVARYLVYLFVRSYVSETIPLGTLIVNVVGCFLLGAISSLDREFLALNRSMMICISVGLIGGFTTFSAFGFETMEFIRQRHFWWAFLNCFLNLFLGFLAIYLGRNVTS